MMNLSLSIYAAIFMQYIVRCVVGHLVPSYLSKSGVLNLRGIIRPCTRLNSNAYTPPIMFIPFTTLNLSSRSLYFCCVSSYFNFSLSFRSSRSGTIIGFTRVAPKLDSNNMVPRFGQLGEAHKGMCTSR